jgi:RNA polymerase sigma-70 factor (ECF subfamily)
VANDLEAEFRSLMTRGLAGDAAAQRGLLSALAAQLRLYFSRRLGPEAPEVEDLVQETLIAVHGRRATYDRRQPFTPWAHGIARYKLIDHWRRRAPGRDVPIDDHADFLTADVGDPTVRPDLDRALAGLSGRQRELVEDVKLEGLTLAEAGRRHGISEGAAKVGLHRAMKALTERMRGLEDR